MVPIFVIKQNVKQQLKKWVIFTYAYYIFFEKFLGLVCFNVALMPVNMKARNRLLLD